MDNGVQVRSIRRSLIVLRAVNHAGSLSMMEIAQVSDIPYPTTCRIVRTLIQEGMLEREPSRKHYRPTVLVKSLSHGFQDHSGITDVARPHIVELTKKHLWPISLVTRVGQMMIVRDCTHTISPIAMNNYQPGATFPLVESASGHVYLAYCDEAERTDLLTAASLSPANVDSLVISQFLSGYLPAEIRRAGYATCSRNRFTTTPGRTSSISAPIFAEGKIVGALTMVVFATSMRMSEAATRYARDVVTCAGEITVGLIELSSNLNAA